MANVTESADVKANISMFRQVMYVIVFVLSILANILLIMMLIRKQLRHRRTSKSFICLMQNIAVANILIVVLGIPLDGVWHDMARYPFGAAGCKIILPLQIAAFQAMIHLFVALVVQRCYGVVRSLYGQLKYFHAVFISLFVWIVSLCTAVPYVVTLTFRNSTCSVESSSSGYQAYTVVLFLLHYLLPVLIMFVLHMVIKAQLNRYKVLDPERAVRRNRHNRIQRMFLIFIPLFAVLLLPKQVMSFIKAFGDPSGTAYFDDVFETLNILTFSVTILIPVLFIVFNPEFLTDFWVFVKCRCCQPSVMMNTTEISESFSEESGAIGIGSRAADDMRYSSSTPVFQSKYDVAPQSNGGSSSTPDPVAFDLVEASMFKSTLNRVATVDRRQEPSPSASPPESDTFESPPPPPELDDYENEML